MKTLNEQERQAYILGDTKTANFISDLIDAEFHIEELEDKETYTEELQEEMKNLREFFEDCFSMLNGHYPCPLVTSDYDKSVIFDAIRKGEQNE